MIISYFDVSKQKSLTIAAKGRNQSLTLVASPLSRRKLNHRLEFLMTFNSDHILHIKHIWTTLKMPLMLIERVVEQASLLDMNIPRWFASKDWNYLLSNLEDPYEELVKEFYANALFDGDELKCWVRGKDFIVTPSYLAIILNINQPVFVKPLVYNELELDLNMLQDALGENLEISSNGKATRVSSLSPELRLLTTIIFHNLYPFSSIEYMNLGRALFLHDLITDEEIDVCSLIFHILVKTTERMASRNYLPFCCLITKILKLKGVPTLANEYPQHNQRLIKISTLNDIIGHSQKNAK